jgi:hypothetical protein
MGTTEMLAWCFFAITALCVGLDAVVNASSANLADSTMWAVTGSAAAATALRLYVRRHHR